MNWYKRAKSLQEIAWDPGPGKDDDYEKVHLKSDMSAIFEQIYPEDPNSNGFDIRGAIDEAISQLAEYGGDNSMWKYFMLKESKDPRSEQATYLQKLKDKVEKGYKKSYEARKNKDEGLINIDPQPPGGGAPPPM